VLTVLLLSALGLLLYTWVGYPLLLALFGRGTRKQGGPESPPGGRGYHLSVVLSAFNEEEVIAARLANLSAVAAMLPPSTELHLFLGVDGASDRTAELAGAVMRGMPRSHLRAFEQRRGKVTVLKDLVAAARQLPSESSPGRPERLLVFTDANTFFKPDALIRLLPHFADPAIGGVCGRLVFTGNPAQAATAPGSASPEAAYWEWETWLKQRESALDSCLGANGAVYAIREELFWDAIPGNTIVDDFVIGMKLREQGSRMIYEPGAVAEEAVPDVASEWNRRVRIGAGDFQALGLCRRCLGPRFGWFAWMFWSHKVLRWFTPHFFLVAFGSAVLSVAVGAIGAGPDLPLSRALAGQSGWLAFGTAVSFAGLLACAALGRLNRHSPERPMRLFQLCDHFVTMQAALFAGFLRWCRGNLAGHWTRTPR
jgi:cellulose synthase/poly-beta-1,6-N-acetylglucosamine synthase-like glycosyltransferase